MKLEIVERQKIYWKLYEESYTNDEILKNFANLMDVYHPQKKGKIIDIGCGQSQYLIDFYKNSEHELYAVDDEPIQIDALKRRIEKIKSNSLIKFSTNKFPSPEFSEVIFSGVIISNLLHFMELNQSKAFIENIEKQISKDSILLLTTHSWKHSSNGDFRYFKHYFRKQDFYKILPKSKYEYLYFEQTTALSSEKEIEFVKEWIKKVYNHNNIYDDNLILMEQLRYMKNPEIWEYYTIVLKRK